LQWPADVAWESIKGNWTELRGRLRMQWGRLTDDQLGVIEGRREVLLGQLQQAYGLTAQQAEQQVSVWENSNFGDTPADVGARRAI
jgi:uncharacterized protein YjbJ (UPF0337 family)